MTMHFAPVAETLNFSRRLEPAPSCLEASARVEAALDDLRAAEASLERQLGDLRRYLREGPAREPSQPARAA